MKKEVSSFYDVWDRKTELTTTGLGIVVVELLSPIVIATLFNIEPSDIWSRIALTFFQHCSAVVRLQVDCNLDRDCFSMDLTAR